jgi:hypothetical protein
MDPGKQHGQEAMGWKKEEKRKGSSDGRNDWSIITFNHHFGD